MNTAYQEGRASGIEKHTGKDALVYKDVFPGACRHCIRLYLTDGIGSEPIIFKLSQLRENGTNIGRKAADWKATVGSVHPYCRCQLNEYDNRYDWNPETHSFSTLKSRQSKIERKSKIKVTIGNKEFLV